MLKRNERPDCDNNKKLGQRGVLTKEPRGTFIERMSPHCETQFLILILILSRKEKEEKSNAGIYMILD